MKAINYNKNLAVITVAALGAAFCAVGAHADEVAMPTRVVNIADLKPQQVTYAEELYQRLRHAAEEVCGDVGSRQLEEAAAARACVDQAVLASIRAVNNPRLTDAYNAHAGVQQTTLSVASIR